MNQGLRLLWLATCGCTTLALAAGTPGEKWKVTTSMQMAGMSMPGMTSEVCKEPGNDTVPMKTEKNCEVYDVTRTGNTQSFKMRCTGKEAMEGSGQFTYLGADHYQGKMQMAMQGQQMNMSIEGQKIGSCDGSEINIKAKQMQAQVQQQVASAGAAQADACHRMAAEATTPSAMTSMCKDPADVKTFCTNVQGYDRFMAVADTERAAGAGGASAPGMRPLSESAQLCGFDAEQVRTKLCSSAQGDGKMKFLASQCPAQAAALAKAQCAGRGYTAVSDKYRDFCSAYANSDSASGADAAPAAPTKKKSLLDKGKSALGGLLGN